MNSEKKLYKKSSDKVICGVCSGIADYFNIDKVLVRVLAVVITLCTALIPALIAYFVIAMIVPNENGEKKELTEEKKESLIQAVKFGLFSVSAGIIEAVSYTIIVALLPKENGVVKFAAVAQLISLALSVIWNFTVNRKFTFKSASNIPIAMLKVAIFYLIFTPLSGWFTSYATQTLVWNEFLVKAICMLTNFVLEFFFCKYVVFRDSLDKSNDKEKDNTKK